MRIIYVDDIEDGRAVVTGSDVKHLRVLRLKPGDNIRVSDSCCNTYNGMIESLTTEKAVIFLSDKKKIYKRDFSLTLFHALCKSDKNEFTVQKAAELGADKVVLFFSENCAVRVNDKTGAKIERLNKIAREASVQCGREIPMTVDGVFSFDKALDMLYISDIPLFFYELGDVRFSQKLKNCDLQGSISIMIGSEGGFSKDEAEAVSGKGIPLLSLGSRILRTETVPLVVLGILNERLGEF